MGLKHGILCAAVATITVGYGSAFAQVIDLQQLLTPPDQQILAQPLMSEGQKNRIVVPFKRALTNCVAERALADTGSAQAYKQGSFDAYVVGAIDQCPAFVNRLVAVYDRVYGPGQAAPFIQGPYASDLPRAILTRSRPQLDAKVEEMRKEDDAHAAQEAQAKADAEVRERQAEADHQRQAAEAEQQVAVANAEADKAKAQERAAAQMAEAERLKQVETATGAAKLLAGKTLDCGKDQLKSLVKSGDSAEVLASALMTMCNAEVDHFVSAGVKEYNLEHQLREDDPADGMIREKLKSDTREHLVALAVQAKAGVGAFGPASTSN